MAIGAMEALRSWSCVPVGESMDRALVPNHELARGGKELS